MGMEESTSMTIEFLRARLLSERSVSRSARQRADELAKKVGDLEEQLKHVTVQRQKAEKATTEVLAILENHGSGDFSEMYDSSSDKEGVSREDKEGVSRESKEVADTEKEVDEESSLDPGFPMIGRSLSWKSCNDSLISIETAKCVDKTRNRSSPVSTDGSSTKRHLGKSCRHRKQGETRSSDAEVKDESFLRGTQENVVSNAPGEEVYFNSVQGSREDQRKETNNVSILDGREMNAEMESALEHRARLIGQFEAQENAQREWEEKYKRNNCNSPDSCEHGNQSDITEERDDIRVETLEAVDTIASHGQGGKVKMDQLHDNGEAITNDHPNRLVPHQQRDNRYSREQQYMSTTVNHSQNMSTTVNHSQNTDAEFSFPDQLNREANSNETRKPEWSESNTLYSASHGSSDHQATHVSPVHVGRRFYKGESSGNALQVATHHETSSGLGGVLDALQQAKLLLKSQLNRQFSSITDGTRVGRTESQLNRQFSSITDRTIVGRAESQLNRQFSSITDRTIVGRAESQPNRQFSSITDRTIVGRTESHASAYPAWKTPGLFRVPTNSEFEGLAKANSMSYYPSSESSRESSHPDAADRDSPNPYLDNISFHSTHNRPNNDRYMDEPTRLARPGVFMHPSYLDSMQRTFPNDRFSRSPSSAELDMSAGDRYSEYSDPRQVDLYRRR